ncbi:MAG: protein kinase [Deltaproteobacteria bacterium]|nr:protein kinase [Deltaproteobacteria bacterium]
MVEVRNASGAVHTGNSSTPEGTDPLIGRVINNYRIVSLIARGGMGKVYRAEQAPLGRLVAIKVLNPNYTGDQNPEFHKRFFLEAATCAKLTHPNTVTIYDYGRTEDDIYYIAMELLEGKTLHRALREQNPFPVPRALHIARQVCRSLREAHARQVIHRDLKPANIFLCQRDDDPDFVKVLDFGLVKNVGEGAEELTQTGLFMGSPKYMAPEQIRGERSDGRVDIYALGVILYEMLTGRVPFDGSTSMNILLAHLNTPPPSFREANPDVEVPPLLEAIVMKCLAKKPEDRYSSMDELLAALKGVSSPSELSISLSEASALISHSSLSIQTRALDATPSGIVPLANASISQSSPSVSVDRSPSIAPPQASPKSSRFIAVGASALIVIGGGSALWFFGRSTNPSKEKESVALKDHVQSPQMGAQEEVKQAQREQKKAVLSDDGEVHRVRIVIVSDPPGATVKMGERVLGTTPLDMEVVGGEARPGSEHVFSLSAEGRQTVTVRRIVTRGETISITTSLPPLSQPVNRQSRSRPSATRLQGYRDDPYSD